MARSFRSNTFHNIMPLFRERILAATSCPQENARCLAGLSFEETIELEALEALPPLGLHELDGFAPLESA